MDQTILSVDGQTYTYDEHYCLDMLEAMKYGYMLAYEWTVKHHV